MPSPCPDLRHQYRDQLPDPDLYPQVRGRDVLCPEHGTPADVPCPCMVPVAYGGAYTARSSARMREAHRHQRAVLAGIPGITLGPGTGRASYYIARHDTGEHAVGINVWAAAPQECEPDPWVVTVVRMRDDGTPDMFAQRFPDGAYMHYRHMVRVLALWGAASPSVRDGLEAVTGYLARLRAEDRMHTLAQELWSSATSLVPSRADGRFTVAGFTEPYPGCWPGEAVSRALFSEDLSTLWPYLTDEQDGEPPR